MLTLGACSTDFDADDSAAGEPAAEPAAVDTGTAEPADEATDEPSRGSGAATGEATIALTPIDVDFGRELVIEAGLVIVTPDIRRAVDDVMRITRDNGGAVFDTDVVIDDPLDDGSVPGGGQITVRIPPDRLDLLIADLGGVGTIRNQTQSVQDVTDRVTDLEVQIQQARLSVERMEALLAEATDFDGLVAAERELVERQTTYERLLAAQRGLDDRIALSTLLIELRYEAPDGDGVTADGNDPGLADAFSDGWNAFVGLFFGIAFVLAILAPFLAIGAAVAALVWLLVRRLTRRRDVSSPDETHTGMTGEGQDVEAATVDRDEQMSAADTGTARHG